VARLFLPARGNNGTFFIYRARGPAAILHASLDCRAGGTLEMNRVSVCITGVACAAALFATGLGATTLLAGASLSPPALSDRKAPIMVCNATASIIRGVGAGWRRQ
jgi:hypothetical protein